MGDNMMRIVREPDENGWYKLESDNDIPTNEMFLYWVYNYSGNIFHDVHLQGLKSMFRRREITHFKPMVTKPPIND